MTAPSSGAAPELKPCPQEPGISAPPSQEEVAGALDWIENLPDEDGNKTRLYGLILASEVRRLRALVEAQTEYIKFLEGAASEADLWEEDLEKMRSLRERISSLTNPGATA